MNRRIRGADERLPAQDTPLLGNNAEKSGRVGYDASWLRLIRNVTIKPPSDQL
jgi:hypothetical protein